MAIRRIGARLRQQTRSLGTRLVTLYVLLLLFPTACIGIYGYVYLQNVLRDNAIQRHAEELDHRAQLIDSLLGQIHWDILYLQQHLDLTSMDDSLDPSEDFNNLTASHPLYHGISLIDLDGRRVGSSNEARIRNWITGESFDDLVALQPSTIQFVADRVPESAEANLFSLVRLDDFLLIFDINIAQLFSGIDITTRDETWVILMQPNILLTASDDINVSQLGLEEMTRNEGVVTIRERLNLYHTAGPGASWMLVHSVPEASLTTDTSRYVLIMVSIVVGALVSVAGLALLNISRMIGPVYQLERMVDQLRTGIARPALPKPLPQDEFGKLITAFDQMADELERKRQTERALLEQLIQAQEDERKYIAYDLHDGLIQDLVGARFLLGQVRSSIKAENGNGNKADNVLRSYEVLTHSIAEGRRIIEGLHPTVLEDLGLEAALNELVKSMTEKAYWEHHIDITALDTQPDRVTSVSLYRISQEALNNAFKHSKATHVWLTLTQRDDNLLLSIRDNGCGFDPSPITTNVGRGWGIRTMRERATMLGGTYEIDSTTGQGTRIIVNVPFEKVTDVPL